MPEVKWVHDIYLLKKQPAKITYGFEHFKPVLTLDQIEAWLTDKAVATQQFYGYRPAVIDDLLAQVQAWRGGGNETT